MTKPSAHGLEPRYKSVVAIVGAAAAVGALIVTSAVGYHSVAAQRDLAIQTLNAQHEQEVRSDRADAYADYLGSLAKFNEFIWANLYWAGSDAKYDRPSEEKMAEEFWGPAAQLQSELEANYSKARMYTFGTGPDAELQGLNDAQNDVFQRFKCMAGLQDQNGCPSDVTLNASHEQIQVLLTDWASRDAALRTALLEKAGDQVR